MSSMLATRSLCALMFAFYLLASPAHAQEGTIIPDTALHVSSSGLLLNRVTTTFDTTVSLTNTSTQSYSGVLSLALPQIAPATVTLTNPTCVIDNQPVVVFSLPAAGLAPGAKFAGPLLKFRNPSRGAFTFTHQLAQGDACAEVAYLHAFSDARIIVPDVITPVLPSLAPFYCTAVPANPMTLSQAMSSIQASLDQLGGAGAFAGYLASSAGATPESLSALAGSQLVNQQGPGALATLLAAHQNDPANPAHLVNAAGVAALINMPNEALALLDAADAIGGNFQSPLGIDGHAIALNNRGFALLETGQFAQAQSVLSTATASEPYLAEGRLNLAVAQLCQGQDASATYLSALHRSPGNLTLDETFDLSQGVAPQLTALQYPGSAELLSSYYQGWLQLSQSVGAEITALQTQHQSVRTQWQQRDGMNPPPLLTSEQFAYIDDDGDNLGTPAFDERSPPGLSDLYATVTSTENAVLSLRQDVFDQYTAWAAEKGAAATQCIAQNISLDQCEPYQTVLLQGRTSVHQELPVFLQRQGAAEQAFRAFADPWYRDLSGLAANLADPLYHQDNSLRAQSNLLIGYRQMVSIGSDIEQELAIWWDAAQAPASSGMIGLATPDEMDSPACPDVLKAAKLTVPLGPGFDATINCEQVELNLSSPGVGPFVNATVMYSGNWTVMAGAAASTKIIPPLKAGAKAGFYLSGNTNRITDLGIKASASFGSGPLQVKAGTEISFAASKLCAIGCD